MDTGRVALGVGLGIYGAAFYITAVVLVRNDHQMRKLAERRWPIDRRMRKIRNGKISQEQWFVQFIHSTRTVVHWVFTPVMVLWFVLSISMVVQGVNHP